MFVVAAILTTEYKFIEHLCLLEVLRICTFVQKAESFSSLLPAFVQCFL